MDSGACWSLAYGCSCLVCRDDWKKASTCLHFRAEEGSLCFWELSPPPAKFFRSYHLQNGIRVCGFNYKMVAWTKMLLFRADLQCSDGETILFAVFLKQILTFPAVQNTVNFFSPGKTIAHLNRGVGGVNNTFLSYPEQVVVCVWVFMEDDLCCHFPI